MSTQSGELSSGQPVAEMQCILPLHSYGRLYAATAMKHMGLQAVAVRLWWTGKPSVHLTQHRCQRAAGQAHYSMSDLFTNSAWQLWLVLDAKGAGRALVMRIAPQLEPSTSSICIISLHLASNAHMQRHDPSNPAAVKQAADM